MESAHYTVCFLMDLVQFIFQHFAITSNPDTNLSKVEEVKSDENRNRAQFFNYRDLIKPEELVNLEYKFYMPRLDVLVTEIFKAIKSICPNQLHLLWFWHVKNSEVEKKWDEIDSSRDSYDRQDNFNVVGLAIYLFFTQK